MGLQCSRRAPRVPTEQELLQLQKIEFLLRRPFSAQTDSDVEKLQFLWNFFALHDNAVEEDSIVVAPLRRRGSFRLVSTAWKNIGFQQENPLQDIRSGGTLAICNLDFFARHYPEKVKAMCRRQQAVRLASRFRRGYPFATASINVTRMICMLFNLVNKYGARQAYDSFKLSFWHLILDPDTDHFRSVAIASSPADPESVRLIEQSEQHDHNEQSAGTANETGAGPSEIGAGSNDANQLQQTGHRKSRRQEPVHLRQHINACLHPVHELYCTAFVLLDRNFRKADALNMEFNLILEQTYAEMEAAMMSDEHQVDSVEDLRLCLKINMDVEPEDPNEVARQRRRRARSGGIPTPAGTPQRDSRGQTSAQSQDSSSFVEQNQKKRPKGKGGEKNRPRRPKHHHVSTSYARQQHLPVDSTRSQRNDSDVDGNGVAGGEDGSLGLSDSDAARTALLAR
eukprot:INCI14775.1.p1 GENE.INCI14775.1~~INCI14775.1.p1  ORF type:complete len:454 (+),score=73.91 INCI14775.1:269-1630(+)